MTKFNSITLFLLLFLATGCAILQPVKLEGPRNSFPITKENEHSLRSLRSIAVVPFIEGRSVSEGWAEEAVRILESKRVSIVGPDMVNIFLVRIKKHIEQISGDERPRLAQRIGKALKTDGVMMGIITPSGKEDNRRIHLELIQTSTGNILWWQGLDISVKRGRWESSKEDIIKKVLPDILTPLSEILGTAEKKEQLEHKKPVIDISPM